MQAEKVIPVLLRCSTIREATEKLGISRRTLSRWFAKEGLPPPNRYVQYGKLVRSLKVKGKIRTMAAAGGWADPFGYSNACFRLTGLRPHKAKLLSPEELEERVLGVAQEVGHD